MAGNERFEDSIGRWLEEAAPTRLPGRVLDATFERTRPSRQETAWREVLGRFQMPRFATALGGVTAVLIVVVVAFGLHVNQPGIGGDPSPTPAASPTAAAPPSHDRLSQCTDSFRPDVGTAAVLGCSRDGTRLLIQKGDENLFILHADGSETQVTEQLSGITRFLGSARPAGATISPDGSRVVFAGLTTTEGLSCHNGALFGVDADGGPADVLWTSRVQQNGIVRYPTFSPDGTQIAFADGYCDQNHSVWVMNADGTDAHPIFGPLGAGHVYGLAWSAAGDRIALSTDGPPQDGFLRLRTYTFATDGSDLTQGADASDFCWPGRQC